MATEVGVVEGLFNDAWFLSDLAFVTGMGVATCSTQVNDKVKAIIEYIAQMNLGDKAVMPQHLKRNVKSLAPKICYNIIKYSLLFCVVWNVLTNIFATEQRFSLFNFLYVFYPYFTIKTTAHNILLHDDYKAWKDPAKRLHVWIPVNFEDAKAFPERLTNSKKETELATINHKLKEKGARFLAQFVAALALHQILPWVVFFFACPLVCLAQNNLNAIIDFVLDTIFLNVYNNRYSHMFGDYWGIINDDEKHDHFGRQYQYFAYSNKPLEKIVKKEVYEKARKKYKLERREAIALNYMGRGAVVTTFLFVFNMLNYDLVGKESNWKVLRFVGALLPYVAYYGFHAGLSYLLDMRVTDLWSQWAFDGESTTRTRDFFKLKWRRYVAAVVESIVAGYLFYKPMMDLCFKA